ncbi:MAG: hypothetical protein LBI64_05810 [Coriobacteriales bacterium]|jgi:hypothetical protein|nr:hypothetical protein [Coriobacteriales bacterium]
MDIDRLTDEVVRRLLEKIRQEQAGKAGVAQNSDAVSAATALGKPAATAVGKPAACGATTTARRLVITQDKVANIAPRSKVRFPKGCVITPLAKDTLKERGISVEYE